MKIFLTSLISGIKERNIFNKSLGLSYLFVMGLFPVLLIMLGVSGYLIKKWNAIVRVNDYLYDILPVDKEYKEAILNNVFITSEQLTANYVTIFISGIITFCIVFYYVTNYIRRTIKDGVIGSDFKKITFVRFASTITLCSILIAVSFILTALLFDPFSLFKESLELNISVKIGALVITLIVSYFIFQIFLNNIFNSSSRENRVASLMSVITFEVFKLFYLYYILFISRPFKITGLIEIFLISFVMLFYFSMLMYICIEYRLAYNSLKNSTKF